MIASNRPCLKTAVALMLVIAAALVSGAGAASASTATGIAGVWSFNGGSIAVQPAGNGQFKGTVVTETKFAECEHPVGQVIWSGITPKSDGSYWGFHQWYFENSSCPLNPLLGAAAFRVVEGTGARYLRVCLSSPGTTQPTIPASGPATGATYGCVNSAPENVEVASQKLISLPSSKKCLSLRRFQIHVRDPRNDAFRAVTVTLRGRKIKSVRRGRYFVTTINLAGLPLGTFTIRIHATTVLGHQLSKHRTYHTCVTKRGTKK